MSDSLEDGRGKTPAELHEGRCGICMGEIEVGQPTRPVPRGSGQAHMVCPPDWPPSRYVTTAAGFTFCRDCGALIMAGYGPEHDRMHTQIDRYEPET